MSVGSIRLALAGSDARLRERVRAVVEARPQLLLVRDISSGEEAIATMAELAPDVLVLDMEIMGVHACSVTRAALSQRPQLGIVAWIDLVDSTELPNLKAASLQRGGVCCCVDTATDTYEAEIEQAIVCASAGKASLSHRLTRRATLRATLTPCEHELLALLAAGWTVAQIARTIGIAPATVSSHTARICRKLGRAGRAEIAEAGRELGLGRDIDTATDLDAYYAASHVKREAFSRVWCTGGG
jgi:DNA-binding NarL/FixJ family response regulator